MRGDEDSQVKKRRAIKDSETKREDLSELGQTGELHLVHGDHGSSGADVSASETDSAQGTGEVSKESEPEDTKPDSCVMFWP